MEPKKYNPFKGCNCGWCRGSRQRASHGGQAWSEEKKRMHRLFRRTGKGIIEGDYEFPPFQSGSRWF